MPGVENAATIQAIFWSIIEIRPGALVQMSGPTRPKLGDLNRCISSVPRLEWPGEGPLIELNLNEYRGPKCGHYLIHPLFHYLCQVWGPWPDMAPV